MLYEIALPLHAMLRWLVAALLLYCLVKSSVGVFFKHSYSLWDNRWRSVVSGSAHVQLIIGFILYFESPLVTYFRKNLHVALQQTELVFFGIVHLAAMVTAVVLITIGAAKAKRAPVGWQQHRQIVIWFGLAALLILVAIPWPFHPLASRPFFRFY